MLSSDRIFAFNLLRWHGLAPYHGTDVAEMLAVAGGIVPGDFESWHREFIALARRVEQEGWRERGSSPATLRDRAFRAASYYRAAAGAHSHPGASLLLNGVVFDWLTETLDAGQTGDRYDGDGARQREARGSYR